MTNLDKLTEKDGGLRKEQNGVTLAIENGKETCIALIKHDPQTLISIQLDLAETAKLMAYLGGKDLLCDSIKQYEAMNEASIERMEELRGTIRELMNTVNFLHSTSDYPYSISKEKEIELSLEKARKQLEE